VQSFSLYPGRMITGIVRHLSMDDCIKAGIFPVPNFFFFSVASLTLTTTVRMEAPRWKHKYRSKAEVDNHKSWRSYIDCSSVQPKNIRYAPTLFCLYGMFNIIDIKRQHADKNGSYMVNSEINNSEAADYALDPQNAEKLWRLSKELVGQKFSY